MNKYRIYPCIIIIYTHPYFGLHFEKKEKKEAENRGSGYKKKV